MGEQGNGLLFQRMAHPVLDPWVHANRLGITLKSTKIGPVNSISPRKRASSPRSRSSIVRKQSAAKSSLAVRAKSSNVRFNPTPDSVEYVQNIVVPINATADTQNIQSTINKQAFSSPHDRARTALPKVTRPATRGMVTSSAGHYTGYAASIPCEEGSMDSDGKWNTSEQAMRFEHEQEIRQKSAYLKRTQVFPHRVDRMYYMSGTTLGMQPRFHVEEEELQRLKRLAAERRSAKHYGRGVSKYKYLGDGMEQLDLNNEHCLKNLTAGERLKQLAGRAVMKKILQRMKEYMERYYREQEESAAADEWLRIQMERCKGIAPVRKFSFHCETASDPASRDVPTHPSRDVEYSDIAAYKLTTTFQGAPHNAPLRYYGNWGQSVDCDCRTPGILVCHQNLF